MFQKVKVLQGLENYHSWAIAMKVYLQHEDVWCTVEAKTEGAITIDEKKINKQERAQLLFLTWL